ncbi:M15 family metallopeptidase [Maribacter chungangensis]|uniref:D-alanyl-D-alanine dipeptidase n=1 Tax=Maribacter chungangensis TaxID=1069117 RepID=A0ABW3B378_9FLAO
MRSYSYILVALCLCWGCKEKSTRKKENDTIVQDSVITTESTVVKIKEVPKKKVPELASLPDTLFIRLADYSDGFAYDMRYATENNFLKEQVYDCAECYTRVKTAKALLKANAEFKKHGVKIKFFDCYRPNSVQYKMWKIVPNPQYVANPKKGSIHNKGGAVDITLETLDGLELDMGTDFDFFGKRAYHDMTDLPQEILDNRTLLKETMEKFGFWSIRTEWWHYNLSAASNDPVANFKWECE